MLLHFLFQGFLLGLDGINTLNPNEQALFTVSNCKLDQPWPTVFIADHLQHFQTQHMGTLLHLTSCIFTLTVQTVDFSRLIAFYMLVFSIIGIVKDAPPAVPVYTMEHIFAHTTSTLSFSIYYHSTIKAQQTCCCKQWLHPFVLFHLLSVEL